VSFAVLAALVGLAMIAFLVAERRDWRLGKWLFKPLASAAFVSAAALAGHATTTAYGRYVLVALALSWLGDVLLIPKSRRAFRLGLASFLVGHLAFAAAFVARGVAPVATAAAALIAALVAWPVGRWLLPHVSAGLRIPVVAYMTAISAMVALAVGTTVADPRPLVLVAALAFYVSDLSVARDRFVAPGFVNRLWGIPLYYAAQLLFAASLR
jgi:uncharacterized membrane protein YhhN